jgi:PEP-CTERM motif
VKGLPMPDTIASYTVAGTTYFVTANEGDARTDDRDISRFGDIAGNDSMNPILDPAFPVTQTGVRANSSLGRLNVSRLDGDTNADGKIDDPTMIGTRSFSIWNATTGALVWDSGDSLLTNLETILLTLDPAFHNMNNGLAANFDTRSDDKGPEPEAITIGEIDGTPYAFVGLERQNGLLMFDISDPTAPSFVSYVNSAGSGLVSPESITFIPGADSPTGSPVLLSGYEVSNSIGVYAVPEPTSAALLAMGGLGFLVRRRCRAV